MARRVTEEERKMAFAGEIPPGRTETWRRYFVWKHGWKAKRKEAESAQSAPVQE